MVVIGSNTMNDSKTKLQINDREANDARSAIDSVG